MKMLSIFALVLGTAAFAEARPVVRYSEQFTCAQVQAVVQRHGQALIYSRSTRAPVDLYDIAYVGGCPDRATGASSYPMFVPTRDQLNCFAGYRCGARSGGN
ncbi:MAG: hypothetical protein KF802_07095 [Bdellovibrionaceae bacterium]|nr:hypothetical protein [Pseudobdellovibrionaceae bacterium]MBX3033063.1 hypothetical protein [Pseudobdellovibrionaceae bacterium]